MIRATRLSFPLAVGICVITPFVPLDPFTGTPPFMGVMNYAPTGLQMTDRGVTITPLPYGLHLFVLTLDGVIVG